MDSTHSRKTSDPCGAAHAAADPDHNSDHNSDRKADHNTEPRVKTAQESGRDDVVTTRGGSVLFGDSVRAGDGGGAGRDCDAFVHVAPRSMPLPVLIAVPHAGRAYTGEVLAQMRDPQLSQLRLEDRFIDRIGVDIAKATGTGLLLAHAPRAMLDLNRAHDDIDWDMVDRAAHISGAGQQLDQTGEYTGDQRGAGKGASPTNSPNARARSGLGLVPRRLPGFGEIWRAKLPRAELQRRIDTIHRPYHSFLAQELARIRDAWGAALLIDLHSMPPLRQPASGQFSRPSSKSSTGSQNNRREEGPAPQIVLGDRFGASCHSRLISRAFQYLDGQGCASSHNRPYAGGYVLDRHAAPSKGIHAVQVEVCRSAYLDASLSEVTQAAGPLANMLAGLVRELGAETAGLAASGQGAAAIAQAAE